MTNDEQILANQETILANQGKIQANQKKLDRILADQKKIPAKQDIEAVYEQVLPGRLHAGCDVAALLPWTQLMRNPF